MADAITPIDSALLPADVRKAGPEAQQLYSAAVSFESVLTRQLATALTSALKDGGDESKDGSTSLYQQMLPDAFTQGVTSGGGLGLARDLYEALKP